MYVLRYINEELPESLVARESGSNPQVNHLRYLLPCAAVQQAMPLTEEVTLGCSILCFSS